VLRDEREVAQDRRQPGGYLLPARFFRTIDAAGQFRHPVTEEPNRVCARELLHLDAICTEHLAPFSDPRRHDHVPAALRNVAAQNLGAGHIVKN
jgi:hypothetical protein